MNRLVSAFWLRSPREVVCGHRPQQLNVDPPFPLVGQILDYPLHFGLLVDSQEERDMDRIQFVGRLPRDAGHANPFHSLRQDPRVLFPPGLDRLVEELA